VRLSRRNHYRLGRITKRPECPDVFKSRISHEIHNLLSVQKPEDALFLEIENSSHIIQERPH